MGTRVEVGPNVFGQFSAKAYVDASACASAGFSQRSDVSFSHNDTDGTDSKTSASFSSGMRLDTTPFPDAPAGALLAVVTPKNAPTVVKELRVVQAPATTMVLSEDSDVYLIANDIVDLTNCASPDTKDKLSVKVTTAVHAGAALAWVSDGIAAVAATIKAQAGDGAGLGIVAQGRITPSQVASIRSRALLSLVAECKAKVADVTLCDPSKLPESVRNFVVAFIDREIERMELKLEMLTTRRALQALALDVDQLVHDFNASSNEGRVAELLPRWTLRNLDTEALRAQTAQLVDSVTFDLYPILQLRYAQILSTLSSDQVLNPSLMTLVNAKWDAPVADLAGAAATAAAHLYDSTDQIAQKYPGVVPKFVALSFPRPGTTTRFWLHVDEKDKRNAQVWDAATTTPGNHIAQLRINPEDLYRAPGGPPSLLCTEEVPVIRDLAIVVAGNSRTPGLTTSTESQFNRRPFGLRSFSAPKMTFPAAALFDSNHNLWSSGGPLEFELNQLDWASMDTTLLVSADAGDAMTKYLALRGDPRANANARGLSPFNEFSIDFSSLYDPAYVTGTSPLELADQIIVTMMVEYHPVAVDRSLSWITTCH